MGSCLERLSRRKAAETEKKKKKQKKEEQMSWGGRSSLSFAEGLKENGGNDQKGPIRVKLVMTKEELQWLMAQLKDQKGRKSLADVLEEMEKARRKDAENSNNGWKPSLDTIME